MKRKILSAAVILLTAVLAAPLAQVRDGRDGWREREHSRPAPVYHERHSERHDYHPAGHSGWYEPRHRPHHY